MKKLFAVIVAIVLVASTVSAQGLADYGAKLGLNFANLGGDNTSGLKSSTGISVGGFAVYKVDPIDLQGEVLYDVKGCSNGSTMTLSYLDINVLAKYPIQMQGDIKPSVYAGPSLGLKLAASVGGNDISDNISGTDFGLIIGVGAAYKVGNGSVTLDVRYDLGLGNINKNGSAKNSNQVFAILVGYSFM